MINGRPEVRLLRQADIIFENYHKHRQVDVRLKMCPNQPVSLYLTHRRGGLSQHTTGQRGWKERRYSFQPSCSPPSVVQRWHLLSGRVSLWARWAGAVRATVTGPAIQEEFSSQGGGTEALLHSLACFCVGVIIACEEGRNRRAIMETWFRWPTFIWASWNKIKGSPRTFSKSKVKGKERVVWQATAKQANQKKGFSWWKGAKRLEIHLKLTQTLTPTWIFFWLLYNHFRWSYRTYKFKDKSSNVNTYILYNVKQNKTFIVKGSIQEG